MSLKEALNQIESETEQIMRDPALRSFASIIAQRIFIARIGDWDNNRWWNMTILGPFGK